MSAHRHEGLSDAAVLVAIGCVASVAAVLWLWGGVAGALFGSGWPHVGLGQLLGIAVRLPSRARDPAAAWPTPARARPSGCRRLLRGAGGAGRRGRLRGLIAGRASAGWRPAEGARWARSGELRRLQKRQQKRAPGPPRARPSRRTRLLYAEHRHALVAFGPPQSGKSAGIAIPALLDWNGPAVASSIKTDLLAATHARRRALGEVFVFDPFGLAPETETHTWSPLHAARSWDGALEVAWRLASAAELDRRGVEGGDFWAVAAEQRLAPLLYTAAASGAGMDAVVRWVYGQGARELHESLMQLSGEANDDQRVLDAHAAYDAVRAFEAQADRTRTSIEATAQTLLRAYRFQRVLRSAGSSEITPDKLLDQSATLYLIGDAKASKLLRPLFLALLGEVVDRAYERATLAGGRLERPLLLCLDEAGNVAPLPNLAEIASTAPSHNIQLVTIFHDLAQARSRYGQQAETAVNSHRARMLLPGVADLDTLRYFAGLAGEEEARDRTHTTGAGGSTRSTSRRRRPLIAPEALRQLPERHALLVYGQLAPTRVRLRLWFEDRRLRKLARERGAP